MKLTRKELRLLFIQNVRVFSVTRWNRNATSVLLNVELFNERMSKRYLSRSNFKKLKYFMETGFNIDIQKYEDSNGPEYVIVNEIGPLF